MIRRALEHEPVIFETLYRLVRKTWRAGTEPASYPKEMSMFFPMNLAASAVTALLVLPAMAYAQVQPAPAPAVSPPASPPPVAASASSAGVDASSVTMPATQFPPDQARALAQGDNALVTNGPVPDTPANRAKYGQPLSHAGKVSPPEGN